MHAEKCPICEGTGKLNGLDCHGCGGKGWVEVRNEKVAEPCPYWPPYYPPYYPYYPYYPTVTYTYDTETTSSRA